jgi:predicted nucleic acid-binding protein
VSLVVVDASVATKWFLADDKEDLADEAFNLLDRYAKGEVQLIVPDLFYAEIANAIWKAVRLGRVTPASGEESFAALEQRAFTTVPSRRLIGPAYQIAAAYNRSVYDAMYVALSRQVQSQLITADERLANALAAHFPVKWLGSI